MISENFFQGLVSKILTNIVVFILSLVFSSALFAQHSSNTSSLQKTFTVFDATLYNGKPDLIRDGFSPIRMIYVSELWNTNENRDNPNKAKIIKVSKNLHPDLLVCVDIEHWPVIKADDINEHNISKYKMVATLIKENNPTIKFGFFSVLPIRHYRRSIGAEGVKRFEMWLSMNSKLKPIAEAVDIIFPCLYTIYPDQKEWEKYAIALLKEAQKYNMPVYAFIWPQYDDLNKQLAGQYIPVDFWDFQLKTCYTYADGIVIWGGWQQKWNDNAPWWVTTKKFINNLSEK